MAKRKRKGQKKKSGKQIRFLFSKGSPLTKKQKETLARELKTGKVKRRK